MDFRGHLRLPEDAGTGIPVLLRLDDIFVVISSGEDELGAWRADDVAIERIFSNQFAIELDGESMVFVAQDALGFAYDGISAIEDLQERLTKRRVFKRSKKKDKQDDTPAETGSAVTAAAAPPAPAVAAVEPVVESVADPVVEPEPSLPEPVPAFEPTAIWSPPSAGARAPAASPDPDFEVAAPEPVQRRIEAEEPGSRPADVRVSYPRTDTPAPPAAEVFVPPDSSTADEPADVPSAPPAPVAASAPQPAQAPAVPTDPVSAEPGRSDESEPVTEEPEPEFELEIEEVAPAATGAMWGDDTVEVEPVEPEIEIEEYVVPSAGTVDMFTAPPQETDEAAHLEGRHVADPEPVAGTDTPAAEVPAAEAPAAEVPAAEVDPVVEAPAPAPVVETPATAGAETSEDDVLPDEGAVASNGHAKPAKDSQKTNESAKRERRHSLFGRSRDKKVPPHDHQYGDPKTIGGLTRQVCEVCGHVTFSGEDVYQGW